MTVQCPQCSRENRFPDSAFLKTVGCKTCGHTWRLAALPSSPDAVPGAVIEAASGFMRSLVASVMPHSHAPPVAPGSVQELIELEAMCAVHDEPFSLLYQRRSDGLYLQKAEKGSNAIDRWCGTAEGRRYFEQRGHDVHYQRTVRSIRPSETVHTFSCPWCASRHWFQCKDLSVLMCHGKSYWQGDDYYGVCAPSCPRYTPKGVILGELKSNLYGRAAQIVRQDNAAPRVEHNPQKILPVPERRRLT